MACEMSMTSRPVQFCTPNRLYNIIVNQEYCLIVHYPSYRRSDEYKDICMRLSHQISTIEDTLDSLYIILLKRYIAVNVVLLIDGEDNRANLLEYLTRALTELDVTDIKLRLIQSFFILNCDFNSFYESYQNCPSFFHDYLRHKIYANEIISSKLYLTDESTATDTLVLEHLGITHIVDATAARVSLPIANTLGIKHLDIQVYDTLSANISQHFSVVNGFIDEALNSFIDHKVLVHCQAGISRSSSLVIAYLMHSKYVNSLEDALYLCLVCRPCIQPNSKFMKELREYASILYSEHP